MSVSIRDETRWGDDRQSGYLENHLGCRHIWTFWFPYSLKADSKECIICNKKVWRRATSIIL